MNLKDLNVEAATAAFDVYAEKAKYHFNRELEERLAAFKSALVDAKASAPEIPDALLASVGRGDAEVFIASSSVVDQRYAPLGEHPVRLSVGPMSIDLGSVQHIERLNGARFVLFAFPRKP